MRGMNLMAELIISEVTSEQLPRQVCSIEEHLATMVIYLIVWFSKVDIFNIDFLIREVSKTSTLKELGGHIVGKRYRIL